MYPEAKMIPAMKIWKLPDSKEHMLSELCTNGDYFAQEKVDGYFYELEKTENHTYLFSRNVSKTTGCLSEKSENVPHIIAALKCLPANTIIIGEIYYPGKTSKNVTTVMGCLPKEAQLRQKNNPIHFYLHDIIEYDGVDLINTPAIDRYKILRAVWNRYNLSSFDFLRLAEIYEENIEEKLAEILASGGEGIVLKKKCLPYYPDLRPAWSTIKVKQMDTVDLVCIGFCDATKEYTGKELNNWPYWETAEGNLIFGEHSENCHPVTKPYYFGWKTAMRIGAFDGLGKLIEIGTVSSGLTDEDREKMATHPEEYLNKVFEFSCMSLDKKEHTLRHPRIVKRRDDKSAKDCKISEIFQ